MYFNIPFEPAQPWGTSVPGRGSEKRSGVRVPSVQLTMDRRRGRYDQVGYR